MMTLKTAWVPTIWLVGWLNDGAAVLSTRYYPAGALTLRTANLDAVVYPLNL